MEKFPSQLATSISEDLCQKLDDLRSELGGIEKNYLFEISQYVCNSGTYSEGEVQLTEGILREFHDDVAEDYYVVFGLDTASINGSSLGHMVQNTIKDTMSVFCAVAIELYKSLVKINTPIIGATGECAYEPLHCDRRNVVLVMKIPPLMF